MQPIQLRFSQVSSDRLFIIAEVGNQFAGDVSTSKRLIDVASEAGADAVKFIFWFPDEILADKELKYTYEINGGNRTEPMYDLLDRLRLTEGQWIEVRDYAAYKNINFMSTVISPSGVDLASLLDLDAVKISSWDYNFLDLWKWCAGLDRPIFVDIGPCTQDELKRNLSLLKDYGSSDVCVLHCFHTRDPLFKNMASIQYIRGNLGYPAGFSSTDYNDDDDITAVAMGAVVLEKRLTLSRKGGVLHDAISKEPEEFKDYVKKMRGIKESIGKWGIFPSPQDLEQRKKWFRRVVADCDIKQGDSITRGLLEAKRGEWGISPEYIWEFVGKRALRDIRKNEDMDWSMVE